MNAFFDPQAEEAMTFCIGWVYGSSAFLTADSAITNMDQRSEISSFGEIQVGKVRRVEEATLKLAHVGHGIAVAYAGLVNLACQICAHIRDLLEQEPSLANVERLLARVESSYLDPYGTGQGEVQLLLASSSSEGPPKIWRWTNRSGIDKGSDSSGHIGVWPELAAGCERMIGRLKKANRDEGAVLARMQGFVQQTAIRGKMIGVGGAVFGARTCAGNCSWQDESVWMFYQTVPSRTAHVVYVLFRNDIALVFSTFTGGTVRCFAFKFLPDADQEKWMEKELETIDLDAATRLNDWIYCFAVAREDLRISLIERKRFFRTSMFIRFDPSSNFPVDVRPILRDALAGHGMKSGDLIFYSEDKVWENPEAVAQWATEP